MGAEDSPQASEIVEVVTNCDDESVLAGMADDLVHEHLAACVHVVGPMSSTYRWHGVVEHAREWQLVAVTTRSAGGTVVDRIREGHPYELPSILVRDVSTTDRYRAWVRDEVTTSPG